MRESVDFLLTNAAEVVTATASTDAPNRPMRMSRRVGVYRHRSETFVTSVSEAPHSTVT